MVYNKNPELTVDYPIDELFLIFFTELFLSMRASIFLYSFHNAYCNLMQSLHDLFKQNFIGTYIRL